MSAISQPAILGDVPAAARYLFFDLVPDAGDAAGFVDLLGRLPIDNSVVVGLGATLVAACGGEVGPLRDAPVLHGGGVSVPSTPAALWVWLLGDDRGELLHRSRAIAEQLEDAFEVVDVIDAFRYDIGRDLSGYVDGTENPTGEDAVAAGIAADGSSFVAVQRWEHDLDAFSEMSVAQQDLTIGRRIEDNEEIDDAPPSAHVKRTAQEDFEPEAFIVRRSMPWADAEGEGLVFVAFGRTFDAFEAQLKRMLGHDDGITDALFRFTRPVSSGYFWCPPVADGRMDLSALGGRS